MNFNRQIKCYIFENKKQQQKALMKKIITTLAIAAITLISTTAFVKNSNGLAGYTGSPGEGTCNQCHSGGNSASAGATITSVPSFSADEFVPGMSYVITVQLAATGFNRFGFGCEILDATNANAGTMQNAGAGVKFMNAGARRNAIHTSAKPGTGGTIFNFDWVAPSTGDTVTIFVAGNAVNFNGSSSGDFPIPPIKMQLKAQKSLATGIDENKSPVISGVSVYPNPASGLMAINYFLSKTENVLIQLIDINGKVLKDLLRETQTPGLHNHFLDLQDISSGIYFVKTSIDNQKVSQKLIAVQ